MDFSASEILATTLLLKLRKTGESLHVDLHFHNSCRTPIQTHVKFDHTRTTLNDHDMYAIRREGLLLDENDYSFLKRMLTDSISLSDARDVLTTYKLYQPEIPINIKPPLVINDMISNSSEKVPRVEVVKSGYKSKITAHAVIVSEGTTFRQIGCCPPGRHMCFITLDQLTINNIDFPALSFFKIKREEESE